MSLRRAICLLVLIGAATLTFALSAQAGPFVAFSLKQAKQELGTSGSGRASVESLGGITHPVGIVYDESRRDLIVVGKVIEGEREARLDDLVVAMRTVVGMKSSPEVSIDKSQDTFRTGMQKVRFEGGVENTGFGKAMLEADVLLKKIGLGSISASDWGVRSYFDLRAADWHETGIEQPIEMRFWFQPDRTVASVAVRSGVAVLGEVRMIVYAEVLGTGEKSSRNDAVGAAFASELSGALHSMWNDFDELKLLEVLFRMTGVAEGVRDMLRKDPSCKPELDFWFRNYKPARVATSAQYPLLTADKPVSRSGIMKRLIVDGGIRLEGLKADLRDGSALAFRDIVLLSKPGDTALAWRVPLEGWRIPGFDLPPEREEAPESTFTGQAGCFLGHKFVQPGQSPQLSNSPSDFKPIQRLETVPALFRVTDRIELPKGGVDMAIRPKGKKADLRSLKKGVLETRPEEGSLTWPGPRGDP